MIEGIPFWLSYLERESEKPVDGIQWATICPTMLTVLGLRNPELDRTNTSTEINEHNHSDRGQGCRGIGSQSAPGKGLLLWMGGQGEEGVT